MFYLILNLQQVEGSRSAEELMSTLQRVVEEQGSVLVASRVEEEERQLNRRLREEQDAAYQAGLQADQVCYYSLWDPDTARFHCTRLDHILFSHVCSWFLGSLWVIRVGLWSTLNHCLLTGRCSLGLILCFE